MLVLWPELPHRPGDRRLTAGTWHCGCCLAFHPAGNAFWQQVAKQMPNFSPNIPSCTLKSLSVTAQAPEEEIGPSRSFALRRYGQTWALPTWSRRTWALVAPDQAPREARIKGALPVAPAAAWGSLAERREGNRNSGAQFRGKGESGRGPDEGAALLLLPGGGRGNPGQERSSEAGRLRNCCCAQIELGQEGGTRASVCWLGGLWGSLFRAAGRGFWADGAALVVAPDFHPIDTPPGGGIISGDSSF